LPVVGGRTGGAVEQRLRQLARFGLVADHRGQRRGVDRGEIRARLHERREVGIARVAQEGVALGLGAVERLVLEQPRLERQAVDVAAPVEP
jgi:hypothetical protein